MDKHLQILEILKFTILRQIVHDEVYNKSWRILYEKYFQSLVNDI